MCVYLPIGTRKTDWVEAELAQLIPLEKCFVEKSFL